MKKWMSVFLVAIMIVSMLPMSVFTVNAETAEFAGGKGTRPEPYLIKTKEQLNDVRNDLNAHYKLIADIEFTNEDFSTNGDFFNAGSGWVPITGFKGSFNGNVFLFAICKLQRLWLGSLVQTVASSLTLQSTMEKYLLPHHIIVLHVLEQLQQLTTELLSIVVPQEKYFRPYVPVELLAGIMGKQKILTILVQYFPKNMLGV